MIKTIVFGKKIEEKYSLDLKDKPNYNGKPEIVKEIKELDKVKICEFEGNYSSYNVHYKKNESHDSWNHEYEWNFQFCPRINISEEEEVAVIDRIFRADLGEYHWFTDKIYETIEIKPSNLDKQLDEEIKIFNEVIINSDEKLLKYCNLFNLIPKNTDCIALIKIIYNNSYYKINNGKVIINNSIPNNIILNTDGLIHKNCIDPITVSYY